MPVREHDLLDGDLVLLQHRLQARDVLRFVSFSSVNQNPSETDTGSLGTLCTQRLQQIQDRRRARGDTGGTK